MPRRRDEMKKTGLFLVLAALLLSACGVKQAKYDAQVELAKKLQDQLIQANKANDDLTKRINSLDEQISALNAQIDAIRGDSEDIQDQYRIKLTATRKEMEALAKARREAEESARMLRELTEKFRSLIDAGKLSIEIIHGRMVLKLASAVLFDSGQVRLKREGRTALGEIAQVLKDIDDKHFQVAGHTDNEPIRGRRFRSNWDLSSARAVQVVQFLQKQGVSPNNLSAAGFSEYQPVASNETRAGKSQNRRIEISILPSIPKHLVED